MHRYKSTITSSAEYAMIYADSPTTASRQAEALKQALDIRKFEIDNYWKRGTYFWTLIAAAFVAVFALKSDTQWFEIILVVCLGFLFSLGWYFVNRGSSAWQKNWEAQVSILEDEVMGPLYKSVINLRTYRICDISGPYAFSPARVNCIISALVTSSWVFLFCKNLLISLVCKERLIAHVIAGLITAAASYFRYKLSTAEPTDGDHNIEVRIRAYK